MNGWPLLQFEGVLEDITLEEVGHLDSLLEQSNEGVLEQEWEGVVVLMLYDILNNAIEGSDLVVVKGNLDWCQLNHWSVKVLLHLIEKWETCVVFVFNLVQLVEEFFDNSALKTKNLDEICQIKLHEWLKE